jgi:hypothetical protein
MKPYKLRQTPFDGQTISIEGTNITFTYATGDDLGKQRTADDGTTTETQLITPSYDVRVEGGYSGDEILAIYVGVSPGYTVDLSDNANAELKEPAVWHDMNTDGRAWAKE